ncbi:hypothetical protein L6164_017910 [Bauhinia variegata]|uniref:Uncharacterized protein n=1 Tax=Bauhinia variegata TaxID=167791 RepID=A0ACB9NAS2_BAUVA|nr:hypothetical protein L6164_017910 [Bauhinia variegata]
MSLVDYASSSDDEVPEVREEPDEAPQVLQDDPPPPSLARTQDKSASSSDQKPEKMLHSFHPSIEKLPDVSLLLNSPSVPSDLLHASDHSSRVAAAMVQNASRKRDDNGLPSSTVRRKVPRGDLPPSRNVPDTAGGMLLPPQISGRKNVVTEDISKLFVKKQTERQT